MSKMDREYFRIENADIVCPSLGSCPVYKLLQDIGYNRHTRLIAPIESVDGGFSCRVMNGYLARQEEESKRNRSSMFNLPSLADGHTFPHVTSCAALLLLNK